MINLAYTYRYAQPVSDYSCVAWTLHIHFEVQVYFIKHFLSYFGPVAYNILIYIPYFRFFIFPATIQSIVSHRRNKSKWLIMSTKQQRQRQQWATPFFCFATDKYLTDCPGPFEALSGSTRWNHGAAFRASCRGGSGCLGRPPRSRRRHRRWRSTRGARSRVKRNKKTRSKGCH